MLPASLLVAAAALLLFLASWILLPAWRAILLPLAVATPELSPWLALASAIVCAVSAWRSFMFVDRFSAPAKLTQLAFLIALSAAAIAVTPSIRAVSTIQRFDAEMIGAFGTGVSGAHHAPTHGDRPAAVVISELFRGVNFGEVRVTRGLTFATPDGHPLTITVYQPVQSGRFPCIVQIYGGSWQRGTPDDDPQFARYFASRGYVVFAIDYRHAPGWRWPAQRDDVQAAIEWIRLHAIEHDADASRMALMGRSAGAHLALLATYLPGNDGLIRSVISYYGPVDLTDGYRNPPRPNPLDVRSIEESLLAGTPDSEPERYRDASPVTYVTRPLPPTLLVYGTRDHIVEARFGRLLAERLRRSGTPAALLEIPWAEHAFDVLPSGLGAQIALYYTERFLAWTLR
jgi:acetyl esterase/lipase